jgi:hypothetical protein
MFPKVSQWSVETLSNNNDASMQGLINGDRIFCPASEWVNPQSCANICRRRLPLLAADQSSRPAPAPAGANPTCSPSTSKGGLFAFGAALAYDFLHDRIRVNTVVPGGGGIVTGMSLGRVGGDINDLGRSAPGTAAGRRATGEDVAKTVAFLLSPDAETLSGTVIDVGCFAHQGGPLKPPKSP